MYPEIVLCIKSSIIIVTLNVYWQVLYPTVHNIYGFNECKINWYLDWNRYTVMGHALLTLLSRPAVMRVWNSTVKAFKSTGMLHRVVRKSVAFRMIVVPSSSRKGSHRTGRHYDCLKHLQLFNSRHGGASINAWIFSRIALRTMDVANICLNWMQWRRS